MGYNYYLIIVEGRWGLDRLRLIKGVILSSVFLISVYVRAQVETTPDFQVITSNNVQQLREFGEIEANTEPLSVLSQFTRNS